MNCFVESHPNLVKYLLKHPIKMPSFQLVGQEAGKHIQQVRVLLLQEAQVGMYHLQ